MNPYKELQSILQGAPLDLGQVTATHDDGATVQLLTGGLVRVRGVATVGGRVYVRGGLIEGPAADLPGVEIEI